MKLIDAGTMNQAVLDLVLANVRTPHERTGDLTAQIASNRQRLRAFEGISCPLWPHNNPPFHE